MALARVTNNPNGRPSNAILADRLERSRLRNVVLAEELAFLNAERHSLGTEIAALSRRIDLAIRADRPDVAQHVAGRLDALAHSLQRRGAA